MHVCEVVNGTVRSCPFLQFLSLLPSLGIRSVRFLNAFSTDDLEIEDGGYVGRCDERGDNLLDVN